MSPSNRPHIAGLAAPGLLWLATSVAFGQATPAPQGPPTPAPTSPTTYRALLLSSGKVVKGDIVEDAAGSYRLRGNGGTVPYPRSMVLKAASSIEELYQFQVARLPAGDPDERLRLARWCLTEHLPAQAREQLVAVQAMCPGDAEVDRMLRNLAAHAVDRSTIDPELRRTSGEMPASLDPKVVGQVQKRFNALPRIFDLPRAQAVVRANEFANNVQPVLQRSCVKCHNEKYAGSFQLVEIKARGDWSNPNIALANLDATLKLINPDDPSRSELLTNGLVPHGGNKDAIFRGPTDRQYTILLNWARSLRTAPSKAPGDTVSRTGYPPLEDGFASDRPGRTILPPAPAPGPMPAFQAASSRVGVPQLPTMDPAARAAMSAPVLPSRVIVEQYDANGEFTRSPGERPEFPTPFAVGGAPAATPPAARARPGSAAPKVTAPPPSTSPSQPPANPTIAAQAGPDAVVVGPTDDPNSLPGMKQQLYPTSARPDAEAEADKLVPAAKKAKKIDNALLEKMIKNRNGTP